ncbi:hypothetical protein Q0Z83_049890 [Actinoplanes sichuanensis]|uniref:Uncharacterized protein n=1 Tax=Actinoplanes sichuanensis TaxID=512349 RepID=A0ABW4APP5_9ACTN|nr:hypothetical protein [Actinoplanes sichuanensis]BEL06798.1 hypothetical protein Q0Z83_049890 [Actinoplanes sichuanensis]
MPEPIDRTPAAAQLAAVYVLGCLTLPAGAFAFVTLILGGGALAGLATPAAATGLIYLAGTLTSRACPATSTAAGRIWWAVAVTLGGAGGVVVGAWLTVLFDVEYGELLPWIPLAGLPYVLIAALFIGRRVRMVALVAILALIGGGFYAVRQQTRQDRAEADRARVTTMLRAPLDLIWTTEIPGYRRRVAPTGDSTGYEPADPAAVRYWGERDVLLTVSHTAVEGTDCGPAELYRPVPPPNQSPPGPAPRGEVVCQDRGDLLRYRRGPGAHEFIRTAGGTVVRAGASTVVDEGLLKEAVLAARPMTLDELEIELFHR